MRPRSIILAALVLMAAMATPAHAQDLNGSWQGLIRTPNGGSFTVLNISGTTDQQNATLTSILLGALDTKADAVTVTDNEITLVFGTSLGEVAFTASLDKDAETPTLAGTYGRTAQADESFDFQLTRTPVPSDQDNAMAFAGTLPLPNVGRIDVSIRIAPVDDGWVADFDVPIQNLNTYPMTNVVRHEDGHFTANLPIPGGASFNFSLEHDDTKLVGYLEQAGMRIILDLERDDRRVKAAVDRPQEPRRPFPYREEIHAVEHAAGFTLTGTLTLPDAARHGDGPYPAAILISGSGQQDRDESIMGHKPFLVIADHLTRHGIAVLRYDDRGVGGSAVEDLDLVTNATSEDFAEDAALWVAHLRTLPAIDAERLGLIGHSEGGLIAPMVANGHDGVSYIVMLAGPGVRGKELLVEQTRRLWIAGGVPEAAADEHAIDYTNILQLVMDGGETEDVNALMVELAKKQAGAGAAGTDEQIEAAIASQTAMLTTNWFKFFLAYDPQPALRALTCPVLAVNGTLDLQVWHTQNLDAIERVMTAAGGSVDIRRYDGLNHLFQPATTGAVLEYASIPVTFDEQVLNDMTTWIRGLKPSSQIKKEKRGERSQRKIY